MQHNQKPEQSRVTSKAAQVFGGVSAGARNALAYGGFLQVLSSTRIRTLLLYSLLVDGLGLALGAWCVKNGLQPFIHAIGVWLGSESPSIYGRLVDLIFKIGDFCAYMVWSVASFQLSSLFCRKISQEIVNPEIAMHAVVDLVPIIAVIIELAIIEKIPYIGWLLGLISRALYYSYVIWTFKWDVEQLNSPGATIMNRMMFLERNWPYFVGYSLPFCLLLMILPAPFFRQWAYAVLLPVWVILTHFALSPYTATSHEHEDVDVAAKAPRPSESPAPFRIPLFSVPLGLHRRASAALLTYEHRVSSAS